MRNHYFFRVMKYVMLAVLFVAFLFAFGFVVEALWNWLMPAIFGLKLIGYWQAVGLILLCKLLFGRFHTGPHYSRGGKWRRRMLERWQQMTPEERAKFREGMRSRCGPFGPAEAKPNV
jgi:hypothetical protein